MATTSKAKTYVELVKARTVKDSVDYLYSITNNTIFACGFRTFRKCNIVMDTAFSLLEMGYITNAGSLSYPKYSWVGPAPDEDLYAKVAAKNTERTRREQPEYTSPPFMEKMQETVSTIVSRPLSEFSDKQLWEELKSRGYYIADNKLQKTLL